MAQINTGFDVAFLAGQRRIVHSALSELQTSIHDASLVLPWPTVLPGVDEVFFVANNIRWGGEEDDALAGEGPKETDYVKVGKGDKSEESQGSGFIEPGLLLMQTQPVLSEDQVKDEGGGERVQDLTQGWEDCLWADVDRLQKRSHDLHRLTSAIILAMEAAPQVALDQNLPYGKDLKWYQHWLSAESKAMVQAEGGYQLRNVTGFGRKALEDAYLSMGVSQTDSPKMMLTSHH